MSNKQPTIAQKSHCIDIEITQNDVKWSKKINRRDNEIKKILAGRIPEVTRSVRPTKKL